MKSDRRKMLKITGSLALGSPLFTSCLFKPAAGTKSSDAGLQEDPLWHQVKYGDWGGSPGRPQPGPMDDILLKDYAPKSSVIVERTFIEKARYGVIDVHVHDYPGGSAGQVRRWVDTMDDVGVDLSVVLTGKTGAEFDHLAEIYLKPYPNRFQLYCGVLNDTYKPGYPERAADELARCYEKGASGVGEITDKGFGLGYSGMIGERLHLDDGRLDLFWEKAGALKIPVNVHVADHPSAWKPVDVYQERTPVFQRFNVYEKDGLSFDELQASLNRVLERHPGTTFIACHLKNLGHDLGRLSSEMEKYSNLYLDISARDYEIGRTPRAAASFLTRYEKRILFGTDLGMEKNMYQSWWRLLESNDEYITGRVWWPYYGLGLPESVLKSVYRENARDILNWHKS